MKKTALAFIVLLAGALAFAAAPTAPAGDPYHLKPGAKGKNCLTCHPDFEETLKLPAVHTPVKAGDCTDCHSPHASDHGRMLSDDPTAICLTCHDGLVPAGAASTHRPVAEGNCVKCHDPHGSKTKNNLRAPGNDLCGTCHKAIVAQAKDAKFHHPPVEKGCTTCHDPHGSAKSKALLAKGLPELCLGCHKADQPAFAKAHNNYPVAKADCTSCHDPHGSSNKAILWNTAHPPVMNKMCAQCHNDPAAPNALAPKKAVIDLCRGCHNDLYNDTFSKSRIHWPVLDRKACLNCHTPHAAKTAKLMQAPLRDVCGRCHADAIARQARSAVKHEPIENGDCAACHAPHASNAPFLFAKANNVETCGTCHDYQKHSSHPIGDKVVDPRNKNLRLECESCHRAHGTPNKFFAHFDTKMDMCVQCHTAMTR